MALSLRLLLLASTIWSSTVVAQTVAPDNTTLPTSQYFTRPQNYAPVLNITTSGNFSPGYIFLSPYKHPGAGAYIYDKFGNLVWDGFGAVGPGNAHDFRVCQYHGQPHLCLAQVSQAQGYGMGQGLIVDGNYTTVKAVQTGSNFMTTDMHEFNVIQNPDGRDAALITSYMSVPFDLSYFNITGGQGWLLDTGFQEVDADTGHVNFEWFAKDHVDPSESLLTPNSTDTSGDGFGPWTAFDFFHINSVEKSASGDYLVSARHTSTIYYVNGTDRNVIWRMSSEGKTDVACNGFNFGFQHDARILKQNDGTMTISIFDNAHDCTTQTADQSSGRIIDINLTNMTATESKRYTFDNIASCSQGNTQVLSNGNVFNGWGDKAWFSEHDPEGNVVLAGTYTNTPQDVSSAMVYRITSYEWDAIPTTTKPQVYSYALNTNSSTNIYVSWNGATSVSRWRFTAAEKIGDPFVQIGEVSHAGFETLFTADGYHPWVMVEAVDGGGSGLKNSSFTATFVPGEILAKSCTASGCPLANAYSAGATT